MNPSFKIDINEQGNGNARLYLELGQQRILFCTINHQQQCTALYCYQVEEGNTSEKLAGALKQLAAEQPLLQESFTQVTILDAFPAASLVPASYGEEHLFKPMLELVHGELNDVFVRNEFITTEGCYNVYAVSKQMDAVINYLFPSPKTVHLHSLLPTMHGGNANSLFCIFASGSITTLLRKEGMLQAVQTYEFNQPEDVAYYLLNLCESFETNVDATTLYLSGMIDAHSQLFTEVYKYFLHIEFTGLPEAFTYPEEFKEFPEHYFSYLFQAAKCV